jgi:phosphatidylethanolamine-binding protein (PEBP) family uncharacterized protein
MKSTGARRVVRFGAVLLFVATAACSENAPPPGGSASGSGGGLGAGGVSGGGGRTGSGGTGGAASASGGVSGSAGNVGSGGQAGSGGSGGAAGTGGNAGGTDALVDSAVPNDTRAADGNGGGEVGGMPSAFTFKCGGCVMMGDRLVFPPIHSAPVNQSPPFTWGMVPAGTMSIAITLSDRTNGNGHWAIWNIPATETMLAANLPRTAMPGPPAPMGARQSGGFAGPGGGGVNMYELRIWALKTAMYTPPTGGVAPMRDALLRDFMGAKTTVLDSQMIMVAGTRGGLGMNP